MKWIYQTTKVSDRYNTPGKGNEKDHLNENGVNGWILCGAPILYGEEWIYYWRKQVTE